MEEGLGPLLDLVSEVAMGGLISDGSTGFTPGKGTVGGSGLAITKASCKSANMVTVVLSSLLSRLVSKVKPFAAGDWLFIKH